MRESEKRSKEERSAVAVSAKKTRLVRRHAKNVRSGDARNERSVTRTRKSVDV